jgi:glycogen debranching enzyme
MTSASENGLLPGDEPSRKETNGTHASDELVLPVVGEVERLVRAHGTMFLVTDRQGDIAPAGARELGLFCQDTRHLSHLALSLGGGNVVRLSAETAHQAYNQIDLMLSDTGGEFLDDPKNFLHIRRRQVLDGGLVEEVVFTNFLQRTVTIEPVYLFGADFADIFEVRGARRKKRGRYLPARIEGNGVILAYEGLCGTTYETAVGFTVAPAELDAGKASFELSIAPDAEVRFEVRIAPRREGLARTTPGVPFAKRAERVAREAEAFRASSSCWTCDDGRLQIVLDQSVSDLAGLRI